MKPERARHVEAWLDGSELDMFKRPSRSVRERTTGATGATVRPSRAGGPSGSSGSSGQSRPSRPKSGGAAGPGAARAAAAGGRRTVTITGRGAERYNPRFEPGARPRPQRRRHERTGYRPDRTALWAVVLCVALLLLATTTSHAATASQVARPALRSAAALRTAPALPSAASGGAYGSQISR